MIDLEDLKQRTNLLDLVGHDTQLDKIAKTKGGEYAGACPFCGGTDRFHVQPERGIWMCRKCTDGKWSDAIAYVQRRDGCDFKTALRTLGGVDLPGSTRKPAPARPAAPVYSAPGDDWQVRALRFVETCEGFLHGETGVRALAYLHDRGLDDATIKRFRLGYHPSDGFESLETWGLDPDPDNKKGVWLPRGIVIPCIVGGVVWYVKFRRPADDPKYICVSGSKPAAIFGADDLRGAGAAWICEGELNCVSAWQGLGGVVPVASFGGSASNRLDLAAWGHYLVSPRVILATFDDDDTGNEGTRALADLVGDRIRLLPVEPPHKDINDLLRAGGAAGVREWFGRVGLGYLEDRAHQLAEDNNDQAHQLRKMIGAFWALPDNSNQNRSEEND